MPEWWSYSLSDFLLFSPRTYYRLIERYDLAVWPAQAVTIASGLGILVLLRRRPAGYERIVWGMVAALWGWVAVAFLWRRYATINWAVIYMVPLFLLELLLLLWSGVARNSLSFQVGRGPAAVAGWGLLTFAVLAYPVLAPLSGRGWTQSEVFGIAPDPTVIGTVGLLLLRQRRAGWPLLIVPLFWCLMSGLTLWALGSSTAIVPALAVIIVFLTGFKFRAKPPRTEMVRS